jgi:hypothetical protein
MCVSKTKETLAGYPVTSPEENHRFDPYVYRSQGGEKPRIAQA